MPQVAAPEVGVPQIGVAKNEPAQINLAKVGAAEIRTAEVDRISPLDVLVKRFDLTDAKQLEGGILQESWHWHFFDLEGRRGRSAQG